MTKALVLLIIYFLSTPYAMADDYEQSEQYQTIKAANESLRRIRGNT